VEFFLQLVVSGLVNGCLYALLAVGVAMIFKATEIVNFAQGELFMVGAYVHYLIMVTVFRLPFLPAVVLSLALVAAYSAVAERLICRPC
jgi:branched-chain amino acid transport system permease protein